VINFLKKVLIKNRTHDEMLYEYVYDEIEQGIMIKGLWAKALAHSDGNDAKAKSIYLQYRVQSLKDTLESLKIAYNEMSQKTFFEYIKNGFTNSTQATQEIKKTEKPIEKTNNQKEKSENQFNQAREAWRKERKSQNNSIENNSFNKNSHLKKSLKITFALLLFPFFALIIFVFVTR